MRFWVLPLRTGSIYSASHTPQSPQRMTAEQFLEWVTKQKAQAKEAISC